MTASINRRDFLKVLGLAVGALGAKESNFALANNAPRFERPSFITKDQDFHGSLTITKVEFRVAAGGAAEYVVLAEKLYEAEKRYEGSKVEVEVVGYLSERGASELCVGAQATLRVKIKPHAKSSDVLLASELDVSMLAAGNELKMLRALQVRESYLPAPVDTTPDTRTLDDKPGSFVGALMQGKRPRNAK